MSDRPIVLIFNKRYLPGYLAGGPIKSIENIVARLGDEFNFFIVTLDRDAGSDKPYDGLGADNWHALGKEKVMYLAPDKVSIRGLSKVVNDIQPKVIYLNSFFDNTFTQKILLARAMRRFSQVSIIIAPRGEFSAGALQLKSLKKKIYLKVTNFVGLYKSLIWQSSTKIEKTEILEVLSWLNIADVHIAKNLAPVYSPVVCRAERGGGAALRICFLSRISPKKNLDFALRILRQVKVPVVFTIYGPQEVPSYWRACEDIIKSMPDHIVVRVGGSIHPKSVRETLAKHELFFLPTLGENYGHAIHEALSSGLPVLISDRTPWVDVEKYKVGWCPSLDNISIFVSIIEDVSGWSAAQHQEVADGAVEYAQNHARDSDTLERNRELFKFAVEGYVL